MNVREAHNLLTQLDKDLAAEPDPNVRAWYELEYKFQPEYQLARETMAEATAVAGLIGRVAEIKAAREAGSEDAAAGLDPAEITEEPEVPTPEEILRGKIERKYRSCLKAYQAEIAGITATKKSKREHQEKMARRQFARQFSDFRAITGDEHLIMRPDLLAKVIVEICDDEALLAEIFNNAAVFAKEEALKVTASAPVFARIIKNSVERQPYAAQFEQVLKGIFASDQKNFGDLHLHLAQASFELLEDVDAIVQVVDLALLNKDYVPISFGTAVVHRADEILAEGDITGWLNYTQILGIYHLLAHDFAHRYGSEGRLTTARMQYREDPALHEKMKALPQDVLDFVEEVSNSMAFVYDPVTVRNIAGDGILGNFGIGDQIVSFGLKEAPAKFFEYLEGADLYQKRMRHLAPLAFSQRTAMRVLDAPGRYSQIVPLSPGLSADVYFPMRQNRDMTAEEYEERRKEFLALSLQILGNAVHAQEHGVKPYENGGQLQMLYQPIGEDEKDGIIVYRPSSAVDARTHSHLQMLAINYMAIKGMEKMAGINVENPEEAYSVANEELRQAIEAEQERFIGRRPIRFPMGFELKQMAGLIAVSLRYEPKANVVKAKFELDDGEVELDLDRQFNILDAEKISLGFPEMQAFYENLILRLVKFWATKREVRTSEGVVSEKTKNSANMGHFAYLRIRSEDGYRYNFSQQQAETCLKEQNKDLATKSAERALRDPSGQQRNSTYVMEKYDPSKPPLEVYITRDEIL